ncbi:glycoside hydrolase family 32 protein [Paenibacillus sp. R14(2021)]|uniref:glycoside hydrolase family 32 protein n=1 Tax=Paenibacillus sp. R14(2021) TaxID=2859228 RepID=UPI001C616593|nr:glycoside hydrolase family 32 protein [Paenibacillus sp. R14(2021)]
MGMEQKLMHSDRIQLANEQLKQSSAAQQEDRYRLRYHLMPRAGWMNDPNGLVYFNGEYHAFYQHDPSQPYNGPMHWGHAKSEDLVRWEHLPVALAPSEPFDLGESGYGCWSGSAVEDNGRLLLIYTGHVDGNSPVEVQCLAVSSDGVRFEKAEAPVISAPPEAGLSGFRDPKVWRHGDSWYMVVGSGKDGRGQVFLYRSADLRNWAYMGIAAQSDGTMGDMWECPDMFALGEQQHVLIVSPMNMGAVKTMYLAGTMDYENGQFKPVRAERLDYGFDFYAPQTLLDSMGRRILLGWMNMWGATMPEQADGWMGAMTVPRELKLTEQGELTMQPVAELARLRGRHTALEPQLLERDTIRPLPELRADAVELIAVFEVSEARTEEFGLRLRCSEDERQYTEVAYRSGSGQLLVDRNQAGHGDGGISEVMIEPMADGRLKLHLLLDRTSVELFANDGRRTITNRIYPDPDSLGISLFSRYGETKLVAFDAWILQPIW